MADKKITELAVATAPTGAELIEIVQGGVNKQTTLQDVADLAAGGVTSVNSQTGVVVLDAADVGADPAGTGAAAAAAILTTSISDGDTTHAPDGNAVFDALALKAPLASPTFTGTPAGPTAAGGTNTTQVATTAFVQQEITSRAPKVLVIACSDEVTPITATAGKVTFRMPYAMTLTSVRASLTTTQTSGSIFTVDINESSTSILSTKLTIDNTETTSTTAATPAVISDSSLADNAVITIDVDQIGDNTAKGLKVYLIGT